MATRCPECNKFKSVEYQDPELEAQFDDDDVITITGTVDANCEECSTQMKQAQVDLEVVLDVGNKAVLKEHCCSPEVSVGASTDETEKKINITGTIQLICVSTSDVIVEQQFTQDIDKSEFEDQV